MFEDLFSRDGLSLERLHALIALAEAGSLTRAAKGETGLQSRLSHRLSELAAFFGVPLTERVGRTIRLTEPGERLVKLTREHFHSLMQFKHDALGTAMAFRLGSADSLLQWLVVPSVARLRRPGALLRFTLQDLRTDEIVARLQEQRLEFGLVAGDAQLRGLKFKPICRVSHFIVVPYRIGGRGTMSLKQALLECPHAAMSAASPVRQSIDRIAEAMGQRFEPHLECVSEAQCAAAVLTGQFAAVLPRWAWDSSAPLDHIVNEHPKLEDLDQKLALAWHPRLTQTRGAAAEQVRKQLCDALAECAAPTSALD